MLVASVAGCEPDAADDEPVEFRQQPQELADQFVSPEQEALAERFDPQRLYVDVDQSLAAAVSSGARHLTSDYAGVANPKFRAEQVQQLVRDSLIADVVVVASLTTKTQENRSLPSGEVLPWTSFEFQVDRVLVADGPVSSFKLQALGGEIDGVVTRTCAMPSFAVNNSYLVALQRSGERELFLLDDQSSWVVERGEVLGLELSVDALQRVVEERQ